MTGSSYGNGVSESRSYNTDNTLASISFSGAARRSYSYGWDDNKNKTSESITGTMSGFGFTVGSSGYDTEDQLVNWERSDTNLDQSWNLSLVGDWDSITENSSTQNRTHGPTHELLSAGGQSLSHDTKGNMTLIPAVLRDGTNSLTLNWDFENKLTTADVGSDSTIDATYKWDALGRRVYSDDGTSAYVYVQVGQQTIADYGAGIAASTPRYRYVYASYIDEPVLRYEPSATEPLYYHRNQQYSIIALTDNTGAITERYAYSAYGEPVFVSATGTVLADSAEDNRYTYTGREWDEGLGLYHFRARMYDAGSGRFYSRDPLGPNLESPSTYAFVGQSPLNRLDPTGLRWNAGRPVGLPNPSTNCKVASAHPCGRGFPNSVLTTYRHRQLHQCAVNGGCLAGGIKCDENCDAGLKARYYWYEGGIWDNLFPYPTIWVCSSAINDRNLPEIIQEELYHALTICDEGNARGQSLAILDNILARSGLSTSDIACGACLGREILAKACATRRGGNFPSSTLVGSLPSCPTCAEHFDVPARQLLTTPVGASLVEWWQTGAPEGDCMWIATQCGM